MHNGDGPAQSKLWSFLFIVLILFLLSSHVSATETVTPQLKWKHQFQFAGYYAAIEKGYYKKAGLKVVLREGKPGMDINEELASNRVNYAVVMPDILLARQHKKPVVVLAAIFQHSPVALFVRKSSGINTPQDLIGKTVMLQLKSSSEILAMFLKEGIPEGSIKFVPHTWNINDFISGKVDATTGYLTDRPFILRKKGVQFRIIRPVEYGIDFYGDCLATTEKEINEHPRRVEKFLSASLKGWQYAMDHPEEMVRLIRKKYNPRLSRQALLFEANAMRKLMMPDFIEIGHMNPGRWKHIADTFVSLGMLSPNYSLEGFIYNPTKRMMHKKITRVFLGALIILTTLLIIIVLILFFNRSLNREVAKRTEEIEKEKRFSDAIISTIPGNFFLFEEGKRLVRWNENLLKLSGVTEEELAAMEPLDWFKGKERKKVAEAFQRLFETGEVVIEAETLTKYGTKPHLYSAKLIDIEGKRYLLGVSIDISERIELEQQLRQAQKMESIGRLAGGIAHDFNNILSTIIGYSEFLLMKMPADDPNREKIQIIHDSGTKAANLTRQLLAFSRKQVLEKKVISINKIIRDFLKILCKMVGEDIVFTTHLSDASCTIEADPGQIEQILMNLVVNARDAMPDGGEIIIETAVLQLDKLYTDKHIEVKPGQYVLLTVSDTGEGMSEEVLEKIFDPFFTTKERGKGTGLGLATVYGIVKQHNGHIYAYSEKGKGTTFKIYFPASKKPAENENNVAPDTLPHGNETILIVDDNSSICQLIAETLKPLGYNCLQASSGKDAIELLHEYGGDVHLLLTDVVMPGMSGRELARRIVKEKPGIKVIFMSGYTENIIVHHGVLDPGVNYIAKPITPVALAQKIRSVLAV